MAEGRHIIKGWLFVNGLPHGGIAVVQMSSPPIIA